MSAKSTVWIDIETTGLDPDHHEIIEIAIILTDEDLQPVVRYETKVAPQSIERASSSALEVSGYNAEDWEGTPSIEEVLPVVAQLIQGRTPAGQNVKFDMSFLIPAFKRAGVLMPEIDYHYIDTASLAWPLLLSGEIPSVSLNSLCQLYRIERPSPHRAMQDIEATLQVAQILSARMNK